MKATNILKLYLSGSLLLVLSGIVANAQTATVTYPFAVGRTGCSSGTEQVHFYTYNSATNTLSSITGTTGPVGRYTPQLRIGSSSSGAYNQRFTSNYSSISYNPADHHIYYLWTALNTFTGSGTVPRTYVWRWPAGTMPTTSMPTSSRLDTLCSFRADLLGVAFDNNGNSYVIEFSGEPNGVPHTAYLRSINFTTRTMGAADNLILTGGAKIYVSGSGDVAMSPSGQMFFVVDNKLFTPNYAAYTGTGANLTCTYIDTVQVPSNNFVGLTYADGETVAAFSGGSGANACPFREVNPLTGDTSVINKSGTVYSAVDMASIVTGIGAAKKLVSVNPTATPNQYDVVYEIYVRNYGNTDVANVQITDDLTAINGAANVSNIITSFVSNPAGLVLNAAFNGNSNKNLLNGLGTLPNYPVSNNNVTIRISCRLSNIQSGIIYNNSAVVTAIGYNSQNLRDSSTNGSIPDLNSNDKPDDAGEGQPTPLLIAITPQTPPCATLGQVFYNETFGSGGTSASLPGSPGGTTTYAGSTTQPLAIDRFMLASNANLADNSRFISLTDHTTGTGRMMVINADANAGTFYSGTVGSLCPGQQYSLSFYAAFVGNSSYQTVCNGFGGFKYPKVRMRVKDAVTGLVITEIATSDITATSWAQFGMKWVMPSGYSNIVFELINEGQGGCGNDLAIDDIQFGICDAAPVVSVSGSSVGCIGSGTTMNATLSDPGVIPGAIEYQWQISTDNSTWSDISGATSSSYTIATVAAGDVNKYYRVIVAASGNLGSVNCRYTSSGFYLTAKNPSTAPTSISKNRTVVCPGDAIVLRANGGTFGTNAGYRWYSGSCGGTYLGSGNTITVNPLVATTYYVRIEGDCNITACASIAITFNCDIDADDDGIPDVTESNGVDPKLDTDLDGNADWRDADYAGFTDANGDGVNDNFDNDRDGVPNFLDRDSDNDGIPDVVEAGGADSDGNGIIDNYTDTDSDGFSQNVDANNTGATGSGAGLGLPDLDGDGVPNYIDLDSDNDGIPDVLEVYGVDSNNDGRVDYSGTFASNDADGDGLLNAIDGDADGNGSVENINGPLMKTGSALANGRASGYPNKNMDVDSKANPYDLDSDGDGIIDALEAGFTDANADGRVDGALNGNGWNAAISALGVLTLPNRDATGRANVYDIDSDDDGIPDNIEGQCTPCYLLPSGTDSDDDGIDNTYDNIIGFGGRGISITNLDGDAYPDYLDLDTDGDGLPDVIEGNDFNNNHSPDDNVTLTGIDTDDDGLDNRFDKDNGSVKGTSAFMGNGGSAVGPVASGSFTTVQKTFAAAIDRDWRFVLYVLNVDFIAFKGVLLDNSVALTWSVSHNETVQQYIVERSLDGVHFNTVQSIKGTQLKTEVEKYSFKEDVTQLAGGKVYYRIKAIANDRENKFSTIIVLSKEGNLKLQVVPNLVHNNINVLIYSSEKTLVTFYVMDMKGGRLYKTVEKIDAGNNAIRLPVTNNLIPGTYILQAVINKKVLNTRFSVQF